MNQIEMIQAHISTLQACFDQAVSTPEWDKRLGSKEVYLQELRVKLELAQAARRGLEE